MVGWKLETLARHVNLHGWVHCSAYHSLVRCTSRVDGLSRFVVRGLEYPVCKRHVTLVYRGLVSKFGPAPVHMAYKAYGWDGGTWTEPEPVEEATWFTPADPSQAVIATVREKVPRHFNFVLHFADGSTGTLSTVDCVGLPLRADPPASINWNEDTPADLEWKAKTGVEAPSHYCVPDRNGGRFPDADDLWHYVERVF